MKLLLILSFILSGHNVCRAGAGIIEIIDQASDDIRVLRIKNTRNGYAYETEIVYLIKKEAFDNAIRFGLFIELHKKGTGEVIKSDLRLIERGDLNSVITKAKLINGDDVYLLRQEYDFFKWSGPVHSVAKVEMSIKPFMEFQDGNVYYRNWDKNPDNYVIFFSAHDFDLVSDVVKQYDPEIDYGVEWRRTYVESTSGAILRFYFKKHVDHFGFYATPLNLIFIDPDIDEGSEVRVILSNVAYGVSDLNSLVKAPETYFERREIQLFYDTTQNVFVRKYEDMSDKLLISKVHTVDQNGFSVMQFIQIVVNGEKLYDSVNFTDTFEQTFFKVNKGTTD